MQAATLKGLYTIDRAGNSNCRHQGNLIVASHISSCARCEEVLAELHNTPIHDCLVERIRNLLSCTQPLDEVDYRWIEAAVAAADNHDAPATGAEAL